jgi:hypothetical protein
MIDTIKLKIPITHVDFDDMSLHQVVTTKHDFKGKVVCKQCNLTFVYHNSFTIHLFMVYNEKLPRHDLYAEFSIPKLVYGQNVYLYYPDNLMALLNEIRLEMGDWFHVKYVPVNDWVLQRLDLCYAWKLPTQELAQSLLNSLRGYSYPRKMTANYDTSIVYRGKAYSGIFYLKSPEYVDKGFRDLREYNREYADAMKIESEGVLRFEMQLRKAKLNDLFKDKRGGFHLADLENRDYVYSILNSLFSKLIRSSEIRIDSPKTIFDLLSVVHGEVKAKNLFLFHQLYVGSPAQKQNLKMIYNNSTITRNLKMIAESGVGVVMKDSPITSLSIPSELVINKVNAPFALGYELLKKPTQEALLPVPAVEEEATW